MPSDDTTASLVLLLLMLPRMSTFTKHHLLAPGSLQLNWNLDLAGYVVYFVPPPGETGKWRYNVVRLSVLPCVRPSVRPFIRLLPNWERDILKTILMHANWHK